MHLTYYTSLGIYDILQCFHVVGIIAGAHGNVTVTSHSDCNNVLVVLGILDSLGEELLNALGVLGIIPRTHLFASLGVFLMGTHHRFMMGCSHHNTHLIC